MIQRIQSLYFLAASVLCVVCACSDVGRFVFADGESVEWGNSSYWPLMALVVIVAALSFAGLMLFKHRLLQMRAGILAGLLLCGWYVLFFWYGYYTHSVLDLSGSYVEDIRFVPCLMAALPFVAIVLLVAAVKAVQRDEMLVRSLDRLR